MSGAKEKSRLAAALAKELAWDPLIAEEVVDALLSKESEAERNSIIEVLGY